MSKKKFRLTKKQIVLIAVCAALLLFFILSAKVIDKGTEGQYTGIVAFNAGESSSNDWESISAEIIEKAEDITGIDPKDLKGKAIKLTGTVSKYEFNEKAKKSSITIVPEGYTGKNEFKVDLSQTNIAKALAEAQTVKNFGDVTNQTEWSKYSTALNKLAYERAVVPLAIDESIEGKTVTVYGAAVYSNKKVTITPVQITIE